MTADTWTFSQVSLSPAGHRVWELKLDHARATFTASRKRVVVTFSREATHRTTAARARMYANAEKFRFMAQMYDTAADLSIDSPVDLEAADTSDNLVACTVTGIDALTAAAVYFGNDFAEAVL
jgi:hypothetical protein